MNKSLLERALGRINALTPEELEKKLIANGIKFNRIKPNQKESNLLRSSAVEAR